MVFMCYIMPLSLYIAGEPLQPDVEEWYFKVVGREQCLLIDAWGQTGEFRVMNCATNI